MIEEWFSASTKYRWNDTPEYEVLVRTWNPGDGLNCSCAGHRKRIACGAPVAVVKQVRIAEKAYSTQRASVTRLYCIRHLAKLFDAELSPAADDDVDKKALEELAQRYWDQFSEIKARLTDELLESRFSALPNGLREQVIKAAAADQADSDMHGKESSC